MRTGTATAGVPEGTPVETPAWTDGAVLPAGLRRRRIRRPDGSRTGLVHSAVRRIRALLRSWCLPENPRCHPKSATHRHPFGEVSATEPAAPTPLRGRSASNRTPSPMSGHQRPGPSPCAGPGGSKSTGEGRGQTARRLRRRSASRTCCRTSRPMQCRLAASIDNATVCANPSAPWERTRSRPRCSRLSIADSTTGGWRLASANACASSLSRSATESTRP